MSRCFVIQPFDEIFTKRFHGTYEPAISEAGLEAYRVDYDPSVSVPIESIEAGIRESTVCLADITLDNPNVWYELGFAFALKRPVVMICSEERDSPRYPFDIQHRTVTRYQVQSVQDFDSLKDSIASRLKAILEKTETMTAVSAAENIAPVEGLSQLELAVLGAAAGTVTLPSEPTFIWNLKNDVERAGFTSIAFSLGVKRMIDKGFAKIIEHEDYQGDAGSALVLSDSAWEWVEANEGKFILHKKEIRPPETEDDIPF